MGKCYLVRTAEIVWLFCVLFFLTGTGHAFDDVGLDYLEFRGPWGRSCFFVKSAERPSERRRGLMFVDDMPENQGMLFIYPEPSVASFWMKNTKIPLDLIFLNSTGKVVYIHHNAKPMDETIISGGENIQYVAEINGGLSEKIGISVNSFAHHKAFSKQSISHCELQDY